MHGFASAAFLVVRPRLPSNRRSAQEKTVQPPLPEFRN
jgi:hypothetical protein